MAVYPFEGRASLSFKSVFLSPLEVPVKKDKRVTSTLYVQAKRDPDSSLCVVIWLSGFPPSPAMRCLKELTHEKLFINAIRKTYRDTGIPPHPSSTLIFDSWASPMSVLRYQEIFIFCVCVCARVLERGRQCFQDRDEKVNKKH